MEPPSLHTSSKDLFYFIYLFTTETVMYIQPAIVFFCGDMLAIILMYYIYYILYYK